MAMTTAVALVTVTEARTATTSDDGEDGARDGGDACDDGGGETRVRWCKRAQRRSWRQQRSQKRRCQGGRRGWWLRRTLKAAEAEAVTVDTTVTVKVIMVDAYG